MKIRQFSLLAAAATLGGALLATASLAQAEIRIERNDKIYVVADNEASGVCKAIVRDQPGQLRVALYHGIGGIDRSRAHTFYTCNDMNLLSFAEKVEAQRVVSYLAPKFNQDTLVTTEEVAAR